MNASQTPLCPPRPYRGAPSLEKPRVICPGNPCHLHPDVYTLLWQGSPPSLRNGSGTWGTGKIIYVKSTSSEARHGAILPRRPCFYHPQSPGPPGGARPWETNSHWLPPRSTQPSRSGEEPYRETKVPIWHMAAQTPKVTSPTDTTAARSYPQLDLGPLAQPLLTGVSGAQSRGVQASALLHTCALITHHLAKSEEGLGSVFSTLGLPGQ